MDPNEAPQPAEPREEPLREEDVTVGDALDDRVQEGDGLAGDDGRGDGR